MGEKVRSLNPYFWFFAVWAFLITPVKIYAGVRLHREFYWEIRIVFAGMPIAEKKRKKSGEQHKTQEIQRLIQGWSSPGRRMASALFWDGTLKKFARCFRCEEVQVLAQVAFQDAAVSAMVYSLVRTVLETLRCCGIKNEKVTGRIAVDFQSQEPAVQVQGIFSARLGTIAIAGFQLLISALRYRAGLALEEKTYAASH